MNFTYNLIISFCLLLGASVPAFSQKSKEVHKEMHMNLLTNAKSAIDKTSIQNYIQQELEMREMGELPYQDLSEETIAMIADLLDEARSHCGKKYRYGSKGPNTFDCSGFTGYVFNQFGYNIGASSKGQYQMGEEVEKSELRPGDLVFFTSPRSGKSVGHVGIVVESDRENESFSFIHAAINNGIKISKSTEPYYKKRYIGAKRIITE